LKEKDPEVKQGMSQKINDIIEETLSERKWNKDSKTPRDYSKEYNPPGSKEQEERNKRKRDKRKHDKLYGKCPDGEELHHTNGIENDEVECVPVSKNRGRKEKSRLKDGEIVIKITKKSLQEMVLEETKKEIFHEFINKTILNEIEKMSDLSPQDLNKKEAEAIEKETSEFKSGLSKLKGDLEDPMSDEEAIGVMKLLMQQIGVQSNIEENSEEFQEEMRTGIDSLLKQVKALEAQMKEFVKDMEAMQNPASEIYARIKRLSGMGSIGSFLWGLINIGDSIKWQPEVFQKVVTPSGAGFKFKQFMHDKFPTIINKPDPKELAPIMKTDYIGAIMDGTAWDAIGFDMPGWWYVAGVFAGIALASAFLEEMSKIFNRKTFKQIRTVTDVIKKSWDFSTKKAIPFAFEASKLLYRGIVKTIKLGYEAYKIMQPQIKKMLDKAKSGEEDLKSLVPTDRDAPPLNLPKVAKGQKVALPPPLPKDKTSLQESARNIALQIKNDYVNFINLIYEQKSLQIYCYEGIEI
jgi:hypothetical protein